MSQPIPYPETQPRPKEHYGSIAAKYLKNALNDGNDTTTGIQYEAHNMMIAEKLKFKIII